MTSGKLVESWWKMGQFPNLDTQFQPGQSGNPKGVPKGTKHLNTWIQELLEDDSFEANLLDSKKGLIEFKGAPLKAIILAQRHKAVNGDQKAVDLLFKYGWPAKTETDVTSKGEAINQPDPTIAAGFAEYLKHKS